jgi:hypothetical protein
VPIVGDGLFRTPQGGLDEQHRHRFGDVGGPRVPEFHGESGLLEGLYEGLESPTDALSAELSPELAAEGVEGESLAMPFGPAVVSIPIEGQLEWLWETLSGVYVPAHEEMEDLGTAGWLVTLYGQFEAQIADRVVREGDVPLLPANGVYLSFATDGDQDRLGAVDVLELDNPTGSSDEEHDIPRGRS